MRFRWPLNAVLGIAIACGGADGGGDGGTATDGSGGGDASDGGDGGATSDDGGATATGSGDTDTAGTGGSGTATTSDTGAGDDCILLEGTYPEELPLPNVGALGMYDPSLAASADGSELFMSFSGVAARHEVNTLLAESPDDGWTWCNLGIVNASAPEPNPPDEFPAPTFESTWEHEVSALVHDPGAPDDERWKLIWHRYLNADDGSGGETRRFPYGWIGLRAAATAAALFTAEERKLFAGAAYYFADPITTYNDGIIGPPELRLDTLDPELADCLAFTEPGMVATADTLYLAMMCASNVPDATKVLILKLSHPGEQWSYVGSVLTTADVQTLDPAYGNFTAPELFMLDTQAYVLTTVVADGRYRRCLGYEIDLDVPAIPDFDQNGPDLAFEVMTDATSFQDGVCTYDPASTATGVLYGEVWLEGMTPYFSVFASGVHP
jgi:hypothetical protein